MRLLAILTTTVLALAVAPAAMASNDPLFAQQWGPQQVRAPQGMATSNGTGTTIGIVDAGVDLQHPDLSGKLVPGATFLGCGANSCGNGDWQSGPADRRPTASRSHASANAPPRDVLRSMPRAVRSPTPGRNRRFRAAASASEVKG